MFLFTLADIYGSIKELFSYQVNSLCEDWNILCEAIHATEGDRNKFFDELRVEAQNPDRTIRRIARFLKAGSLAPDGWEEGQISERKVQEIFEGEVLTARHTFYNNFALICKLDYGLRFKCMIMEILS